MLDAFLRACVSAAKTIPPRETRSGRPADGPAEAQLEESLFSMLPKLGVPRNLLGARLVVVDADWDPVPNGLDFHLWERPDDKLDLVSELKFDDIEQRMWDLFKVLAARKLPGGPTAVLVHGAAWTRPKPCSELFPSTEGATVEVETRALIRSNSRQWAKDLAVRGRVLRVPHRIRCTSRLAGVRLRSYPTYELRVAEVEPIGDDYIEFHDGWPVGDA